MTSKLIIDQYLSRGKVLTILDGKKPLVKEWTSRALSREQLHSHDGNIGWVLGKTDLVVDVDPRNGGDESFAKLLKTMDLTPTVNTPSGGVHVYLSVPDNVKLKKKLKDYPGIDFLSVGSQCVIPSSKTETGEYCWVDDLFNVFCQSGCPGILLGMLEHDNRSLIEIASNPNFSYSEEHIEDLLSKLNPSASNDEWVRVGMALHDWNPDKGLELWENWSQAGDNYAEGETSARWASFSSEGGVSIGTLIHMNKVALYDEVNQFAHKLVNLIDSCDDKQIEFDVIPKILRCDFDAVNRERLAKAIQLRYKQLLGVKVSIAEVRRKLDASRAGGLIAKPKTPAWCLDWAYINSHGGFMDLRNLTFHRAESFNMENGRNVPENCDGHKLSAVKYVADNGFVRKVDTLAYLPMLEDKICEIDNRVVLNTFDREGLPKEVLEFNEEALAVIEMVKAHIKFVCTTDEDSKILTEWLAWQVQHPGEKILWAPIIQSVPGTGKSFFGELLRMALGDRNVGTVSSSQATSSFNGWAVNVAVNVLEELRVKGHNRHEIINALKPLITDRIIQINDKGVAQHATYNTANYICFTNYKDALPLDENDRRWWVVFMPIQRLHDLRMWVGMDKEEYFPKLFGGIRKCGGAIRKWLLEVEISDEFKGLNQAPVSASKDMMIATEDAGMDGFLEIKEMVARGGEFYGEELISSADLFEAHALETGMFLSNRQKHVILKKLGYSAFNKLVMVDGKPRRLWSKVSMTNKEAREIFNRQEIIKE